MAVVSLLYCLRLLLGTCFPLKYVNNLTYKLSVLNSLLTLILIQNLLLLYSDTFSVKLNARLFNSEVNNKVVPWSYSYMMVIIIIIIKLHLLIIIIITLTNLHKE